jgi:hypothetical protein
MKNFQLSGADLEIHYHNEELTISGKGLPVRDEAVFSGDQIAKSKSDIGSRMTVVLLNSSRNGTRFLLHLIIPATSPSEEDLAITGAAIFVRDFSTLVGGAPHVLQEFDVRPLTGTMLAG